MTSRQAHLSLWGKKRLMAVSSGPDYRSSLEGSCPTVSTQHPPSQEAVTAAFPGKGCPRPVLAWKDELACCAWTGTSISCPQTSVFLLHQPLDSDWDLNHWLPWFSGLWVWAGLHHCLSWLSSLQTADHGTFQPPWPACMNQPFIRSLLLYIFYWLCFSGEP